MLKKRVVKEALVANKIMLKKNKKYNLKIGVCFHIGRYICNIV